MKARKKLTYYQWYKYVRAGLKASTQVDIKDEGQTKIIFCVFKTDILTEEQKYTVAQKSYEAKSLYEYIDLLYKVYEYMKKTERHQRVLNAINKN